MKKAFTLIELLVVVLIIGILAAIALPQYRIAVAKTQYATAKQLVTAIKNAQEVYYLANGSYATNLDDLDIDFPASKDERNTNTTRYYEKGTCVIEEQLVRCNLDTAVGRMGYQAYYAHIPSNSAGKYACVAFKTIELTSPANKICKTESGKETGEISSEAGYTYWLY